MDAWKALIWSLQLFSFHQVYAGNYAPCTANYCQNGGQCIPMSTSPSPAPLPETSKESLRFFLSPSVERESWSYANQFCKSLHGVLFEPSSKIAKSEARNFLLHSPRNLDRDGITGLWTGRCEDTKCEAVTLDDDDELKFEDVDISKPMTAEKKYIAFCSMPKEESTSSLIYTCQCKNKFGYENCTAAESGKDTISPGFTYCQSKNKEVVIKADTTNSIIFIDHVVFGKPFYQEGSLIVPPSLQCPKEFYAKSEDEFCVSPNSLSAVIYWCQGKQNCSFTTDLLLDTPDLTPVQAAKEFYIADEGVKMTYTEAVSACQAKGHSLAELTSIEDAKKLRDVIGEFIETDEFLKAFWIDPESQNHLESLNLVLPEKLHENIGCLVVHMPKNSRRDELFFHWKSCFSNAKLYSAICQTLPRSRRGLDAKETTCLMDISNPVIEYRIHMEAELNSKDVNCPMKVNFRLGNTCYKKTDQTMDWYQAREQCWRWGGELAFPLPKEECNSPTYVYKSEELWMAGPQDCGEARCPIPFSSKKFFVEGTFDKSNDLCFTDMGSDEGCSQGSCNVKRRGLCALAPAKSPRTPLPPTPESKCPPVTAGSSGWPFPNYDWNQEGIPGEISRKPCPDGQNGEATWFCGKNGDWIGLPDLTNCRVLDTETALDELNNTSSVPSQVLKKFYKEVADKDTLGAGDISAVIGVLDQALKYQKERIDQAEDKEEYADVFTSESLNLFDNLLKRQDSWLGIPDEQKKSEVTKIQQHVEDTAISLIKYSVSDRHDYNQLSNVVVKVLKNVDTTTGQDFSSVGSSLSLSTTSTEKRSITFMSFGNLACVLQDLYECTVESVLNPEKNVLNSAVLGAAIYDENGLRQNSDELTVTIRLKHLLSGNLYNITGGSCVFWNNSLNDWSDVGCTLVESTPEQSTCQCNHLTNFGVIMDVNGNLEGQIFINALLDWITLLGCSLSIISLAICIYVFTFVPGLRGDRTTIHRNLCICLLIAEFLLVVGLDATENAALCATLAGFLHFFFLASFTWMLVEGVHVYYMLVKVFDTGKSLLWIFYTVGYGLPAAVVLLSVIIVESTGSHGYGSPQSCWLSTENGLIWAFAGPVAVIIVINSCMFGVALTIARRSVLKRQNSESKSSTMTLLKGSFSLLCILGLTWIFGFTYFANGTEWLAIIFALLNSFQGFFILIFHVVFNDKAKQEVVRHSRIKYRMAKSFILRKPYEPPQTSTMDSSTAAASRAGKIGGRDMKGSNPNRKISVETTLTSNGPSHSKSAEVDAGESPKVKYTHGKMSVAIQKAGPETIPEVPDDIEMENSKDAKKSTGVLAGIKEKILSESENSQGSMVSRLRARLNKKENQ